MHNVFSDKMFLNRKDYLLNVNESSGKITKHEYYLKVWDEQARISHLVIKPLLIYN